MEARIRGGKSNHFYGHVVPEAGGGPTSSEWDLNDWKWDGDLFRASPISSSQLDRRSKQILPSGADSHAHNSIFSKCVPLSLEDSNPINNGDEKREAEKRRRGTLDEDVALGEGTGCLSLKLGGQVYTVTNGDLKGGKKTKCGGSVSGSVVCQVDGCAADLSNSKDYHRRHKVCEMHSKAGEAIVGNVVQRFCQQCSRFHVLQEFDEGKRSCRRRLAGHNRRRRKTHPDPVANGVATDGGKDNNYILISLLRILANMPSSSLNQTKERDLLSHLLRNLAGSGNEQNIARLLLEAKSSVPASVPESEKASGSSFREPAILGELNKTRTSISSEVVHYADTSNLKSIVQFPSTDISLARQKETETTVGKGKPNNFDLNYVYDENIDKDHIPASNGSNSNSTSTQSPSSSSGEVQSRTDRIVFKLFGKDPNDLPCDLRKQILDWLSQSPTDIESYIRPGCIILTVYLRVEKSIWEELCCNLGANLRRLLEASDDPFWGTGWIFTRVRGSMAFAYNGNVVLDTQLPLGNHENCRIAMIKPVAVSASENAQFHVKGFNLLQSTSRLICTHEGRCLTQRSCYDLIKVDKKVEDPNNLQSLTFSCPISEVCGRGFIEVEDCSLNSDFFPFIIAEEEVCLEIRALENTVATFSGDHEMADLARVEALEFIHEMGWLLQRNRWKLRLEGVEHRYSSAPSFPLERFKWLLEFAVEKDWCAVAKKLLGVLFDKAVGPEEQYPLGEVLIKMGLLHRAVKRNSKAMVEFLLWYVPEADQVHKLIFKPDAAGPGGLTPLHIAASTSGSELVLDALTNDPASVGLEAWKTARDDAGLTPNDYACLRHHYSYIHLVQRKINRRFNSGHSVVDIPSVPLPGLHRSSSGSCNEKASSFETEKKKTSADVQARQGQCRLCELRRIPYRTAQVGTSLFHRPTMFSMVAIAAVCVCVALYFKSSPYVVYGFRPFRWERLKYGPM